MIRNSFYKCESSRRIIDALEDVPLGLNDAYQKTLLRALGGDQDTTSLVTNILVWLLAAQRPLKLAEIWEAVLIRRKKLRVADELRWFPPFQANILDRFGGLVAYNQDSGTVTLANSSVKAFLSAYTDSKGDHPFGDSKVYMTTAKLVVCYALLDFAEPEPDRILRKYASDNLIKHLQGVRKPDTILVELTASFVTNIIRTVRQKPTSSSPWRFGWSMLQIITSEAFLDVAKRARKEEAWIHGNMSAYGCTPLMLAIDQQDGEVVKALLYLGADVKQRSCLPDYARGKTQDSGTKVDPLAHAKTKPSRTIQDILAKAGSASNSDPAKKNVQFSKQV